MKKSVNKFWEWYENNLHLNIGIAFFLFSWQLVHLIWLFGDVILRKIWGLGFFDLSGIWAYLIVFIDYTEIPVLISVSLIYINDLRKGFNLKSLWFLIFLNTQWLHLFWITDEFVIERLIDGSHTVMPIWLAWVAIAIDYLELPVMHDTAKRFLNTLKNRKSPQISRVLLGE